MKDQRTRNQSEKFIDGWLNAVLGEELGEKELGRNHSSNRERELLRVRAALRVGRCRSEATLAPTSL